MGSAQDRARGVMMGNSDMNITLASPGQWVWQGL